MGELVSFEQLNNLYIHQNKTREEVADYFHVSLQTVKRYIRKWNIVKPKEMLISNRQKTNLIKFGATSYRGSEEGSQRIEQSCLETYGSKCSLCSPTVKQKAIDTMLSTYGVEHSAQSKDCLDKKSKTMFERYGYGRFAQIGHDLNNIEIIQDKNKFRKFILSHTNQTYYDIAQKLEYDITSVGKYVKTYGLESIINYNHFTSSYEIEIQKIFKEKGVDLKKNKSVIYPYEIDLYSEEHKIGIEFNGNWFHREEAKGRLYHQKKSLLAEEKGVFIYHIFEYEWNDLKKRETIVMQLNNLFKKI